MGDIEQLTHEERKQVFWREELGDAAREKALRIIDQQAARIVELERLLNGGGVVGGGSRTTASPDEITIAGIPYRRVSTNRYEPR